MKSTVENELVHNKLKINLNHECLYILINPLPCFIKPSPTISQQYWQQLYTIHDVILIFLEAKRQWLENYLAFHVSSHHLFYVYNLIRIFSLMYYINIYARYAVLKQRLNTEKFYQVMAHNMWHLCKDVTAVL